MYICELADAVYFYLGIVNLMVYHMCKLRIQHVDLSIQTQSCDEDVA